MGLMKRIFWICVGMTLWGCAGATFSYHWYGLDLPSYSGKLLGPKPADDLDFAACAPEGSHKGKCAVFLSAELKALINDYEGLQIDLKKCQQALVVAQK